MIQPDLFDDVRVCGDCVVWNGGPRTPVGGCSVHGDRRRFQAACERWFPLTQLNAPLYGRVAR